MKSKNMRKGILIGAMFLGVFAFKQVNARNSTSTEAWVSQAKESAAFEGNDKCGCGMCKVSEKSTAEIDITGEPEFMQNYTDIGNALVNDKYDQVKQAASDMQKSIEGTELNREQRNQLKESAGKLAEAQDIKSQRQAFVQLSQQLYQVVQNNNVTDKPLYWQHCPMAMGGQGANWLSYNEKVQNPYMGQRMPGCGSVEETIN
jgi:hypothetical protein